MSTDYNFLKPLTLNFSFAKKIPSKSSFNDETALIEHENNSAKDSHRPFLLEMRNPPLKSTSFPAISKESVISNFEANLLQKPKPPARNEDPLERPPANRVKPFTQNTAVVEPSKADQQDGADEKSSLYSKILDEVQNVREWHVKVDADIKQKDQRIRLLESSLESQGDVLTRTRGENDELRATMGQEKEKRIEISRRIESIKELIQVLKSYKSEVDRKLDLCEKFQSSLSEVKEEQQRRVTGLESRFSDLSGRVDDQVLMLTKQLAEQKNVFIVERNKFNHEIKELKDELVDTQRALDDTSDQVRQQHSHIDLLKQQLVKANKDTGDRDTSIQSLEGALSRCRTDLDCEKKVRRVYEDQKLASDIQLVVETIISEVSEQENSVVYQDLLNTLNETKRLHEQSRDEIYQVQAKLYSFAAENEDFCQQIERMKSEKDLLYLEKSQFQMEVTELTDRIKHLSTSKSEVDRLNDGLQIENKMMQGKCSLIQNELATKNEEIQSKEETLVSAKKEMDHLNAQILLEKKKSDENFKRLVEVQDELSDAAKRVKELESDLQTKSEEIKCIEGEIKAKTDLLEAMKQEREQLMQKVENQEVNSSQMKNELVNELKTYQEKQSKLDEQLSSKASLIEEFKKMINRLEQDVSFKENRIAVVASERQTFKDMLEQVKTEKEKAAEEAGELKSMIQQILSSKDNLNDELGSLRSMLLEKSDEISVSKQQSENIKDKLTDMELELDSLKKQKSLLEETLSSTLNEKEKMEEKFSSTQRLRVSDSKKIEEQDRRIKELESKYDVLDKNRNVEKDRTVMQLVGQVEDLQKRLSDLLKEKEKLVGQLEIKEKQFNEMCKEKEKAKKVKENKENKEKFTTPFCSSPKSTSRRSYGTAKGKGDAAELLMTPNTRKRNFFPEDASPPSSITTRSSMFSPVRSLQSFDDDERELLMKSKETARTPLISVVRPTVSRIATPIELDQNDDFLSPDRKKNRTSRLMNSSTTPRATVMLSSGRRTPGNSSRRRLVVPAKPYTSSKKDALDWVDNDPVYGFTD